MRVNGPGYPQVRGRYARGSNLCDRPARATQAPTMGKKLPGYAD